MTSEQSIDICAVFAQNNLGSAFQIEVFNPIVNEGFFINFVVRTESAFWRNVCFTSSSESNARSRRGFHSTRA